MKKIFLLVPLFFIGCCFSSAKLRVLDNTYTPQERTLSYEGSGIHYSELRMALMEYGIKVLKYNTRNQSFYEEIQETSDNIKSTHKVITNTNVVTKSKLLVSISDIYYPDIVCLTGAPSQVYQLFVEITDLETNEVVFTIKAKGMNEPCGYCRRTVYENVAEKINEFFNKRI